MNVDFPEKLRPIFHPNRTKVAHGGRGSAKSWGFARALLIQAAQTPLRVLCAREVQKSIKDSVHRLLSDQIQAMGLGGHYEVLDTEIRGKNGSLFLFAGLATHTVESIKSFEGVDRCWVEEAQTVTKRSWDVLTPTIRKDGSEIWVTLNPDMETDETYQRFVANAPEGAFVVQMNWRDNPWFPSVLEVERQETLRRDPDNYQNIWEGVPRRVSEGAIYRHEIERLYEEERVRQVPYDPLLKAHSVWDLGWNDAMTIGIWQRSGAEVRCIDYIEDSHRTLDYYVAQLEKRPYRWGTDFIPHDGKAKNTQTGKSTEEALRDMGRRVVVLPALNIEEGIKAARMMFPRVYIDKGKAKDILEKKDGTPRLLECLKRYQRSINEKTREPGAPLHDEFSHGADMFRYAGMSVEQMANDEYGGKLKYPFLGNR
jgi:phage terminase large subunit